jgi:hypothetical protein
VDEETSTKQYETVILLPPPSFLLILPLLQARSNVIEDTMFLLPGSPYTRYSVDIYYIVINDLPISTLLTRSLQKCRKWSLNAVLISIRTHACLQNYSVGLDESCSSR